MCDILRVCATCFFCVWILSGWQLYGRFYFCKMFVVLLYIPYIQYLARIALLSKGGGGIMATQSYKVLTIIPKK